MTGLLPLLSRLTERVDSADEPAQDVLHSPRKTSHRRLQAAGELRQQHFPGRELGKLLDLVRANLAPFHNTQLDGGLVVELPGEIRKHLRRGNRVIATDHQTRRSAEEA